MQLTYAGPQIACRVDLGNGRAGEMELSDDVISVLANTGIMETGVCVKSVAQQFDLRVVIRRLATGVEVALERIEDAAASSTKAKPYLRIAVDTASSIASVIARGSFGDVLLNQFPV